MNRGAMVERDVQQRIPANIARCVQPGHDDPPVRPHAVAPEHLAILVAAGHLLERGRGAICQSNARIPTEAARVRAFSQAHGEHIARDAEIFDSPAQHERVGRNDAYISPEIDHRLRIKILGIDDGAEHVGEDLELVGDADVVAVRRHAVTDHAVAHLRVDERLDHSLFERHFLDPVVGFQAHDVSPRFSVSRRMPCCSAIT